MISETEESGGHGGVSASVRVGSVPIAWQLDEGVVTFSGMPMIMGWVDTTLAGLMKGFHDMVGTKRFALALQADGRESVEEDFLVISAAPTFAEGFAAIAEIAAVAGWGRWELVESDMTIPRRRFRVYNGWESVYQSALGVDWGCAFVAGKFAGYCSRSTGRNCWATQTHFRCKGDPYDEFVVSPSDRTVEEELDRLLEGDAATRADMAVGLRRLRQEMASRRFAEEHLKAHQDVVFHMQTGLHVYHLEDPSDKQSLRFLSTNPQGERLLGLSGADLVGKRIGDCFPNAHETGLSQIYAQLARSGESLDLGDVYYEDARCKGWYHVHAFGLPGVRVGVTFDDVTASKQMEQALTESQGQLRSLGRHMETVREGERQGVAHLLDEEMGQVLAALRMGLCSPCEPGTCHERDQRLIAMVDDAIATLKHISLELRPPELAHLGFTAAVHAECDRTRERRGLDIRMRGEISDELLGDELAITLFRIIGAVVVATAEKAVRVDVGLLDEATSCQISVDVRFKENEALSGNQQALLATELRERIAGWDGQVSLLPLDLQTMRFLVTVPFP